MEEQPEGSGKKFQISGPWLPLVAALIGDALIIVIAVATYTFYQPPGYNAGLFVVLPFFGGWAVGGSYRWMLRSKPPAHLLTLASLYATAVPIPIALVSRFEGVVCLIMAFPLIFLLIYLGALLGSAVFSMNDGPLRMTPIALLPLLLVYESNVSKDGSYHAVTTRIIVNAPASKIWPYLVNLNHITPTTNLLFAGGVARPMSTHTNGAGLGAPRFCELSTGEMPEIISTWQPGKLLVFDMRGTPACMKELNPFGPVYSGHLRGYFTCHEGRFQLHTVGPNRTEIIGTSTYDHRLGPSWYWTLWCTYIVHCVHSSVLEEIKRRAEHDTSVSQ